MGREKTRVNDSEGVRKEKIKGIEKKWESLAYHEREKTLKHYVSHGYRQR